MLLAVASVATETVPSEVNMTGVSTEAAVATFCVDDEATEKAAAEFCMAGVSTEAVPSQLDVADVPTEMADMGGTRACCSRVSERRCDGSFQTYRRVLSTPEQRSMGRLKEKLCQWPCHRISTETRVWAVTGARIDDHFRTRVDKQPPAGVDNRAEVEVGGRAGAGVGSEAKLRAERRFRTGAEGGTGSGDRAPISAGVGAGVETRPDVRVGIAVRCGNDVARLEH
jgi:hypothetical protein